MSHPPIALPRLIPVPPCQLFLPPSHWPASPTYCLSCTSRELSCLTCCLSRSSSTLDLFFVHCLFRSALFAACLALLASYPVQLAGRPVKQDTCPVTPAACLILPLPMYSTPPNGPLSRLMRISICLTRASTCPLLVWPYPLIILRRSLVILSCLPVIPCSAPFHSPSVPPCSSIDLSCLILYV